MDSKSKLALVSEGSLVSKTGSAGVKVIKDYAIKSGKDVAQARVAMVKAIDADAVAFAKIVRAGGFRTSKNDTISSESSQKGLRFVTALASQSYAKADIDSVLTEQSVLLLDAGAYSALYASRFAVAMGWLDNAKSTKAVEAVITNPKGKAITELRNISKVAVGAKIKPKVKAEPERHALAHWLGMIEKTDTPLSRGEFLELVRESTKTE
jgi:hypothetical protein